MANRKADEPRRSGRATKGQHTKDREAEDAASKGKKGKKGSKAKQAEAEEIEEEEDELIRCVCGQYEEEEDVPRAMICCDKCSAWQHNDCMGLEEDYAPDKYFCEQCRPQDHKELLAAMARGEKPWEESDKRREAMKAAKGKKGKKGGKKQSIVHEAPEREETPVKPASGQKRKAEETPVPEVKSKKVRGTPAAENGTREPSQPRPTPVRQPSRSETTIGTVASDPKELPNAIRKGAAGSLVKVLGDTIKDAVKKGLYKLPSGSTAQSLGSDLGLRVEHALNQIQAQGLEEPGDAYKNQLRSISFNVKRNSELGLRIISGDITPNELASMDPKEFASEEQQRKDAALQAKMEKQHEIMEEQGPRIRRTHKGDEYVDEAHSVAPESATSRAPPRKQVTVDEDADMKSPDGSRPPLSVNTQAKRSSMADPRRKSSSNFDIDKVWSGVQASPDAETTRFPEIQQRGSPPPHGAGAAADPEIDNLLKDEENDSEPYSPKEFNDEGVVWSGSVNGGSLGQFATVAKYAAGAVPEADTLRLTWDKVIPKEIAIHGRIQPQKADEYLCGLEYSNTSDVIVVTMSEPRTSQDMAGFDKFFQYLKNKQRYGVGVQHENPAIKDIYLLPMDAGQPLPTFMKALETDFPDPIRERMLLVPIVIKNSELPHNLNAAGQPTVMSPSIGPPVAQTPLTPQEGQRDMSFSNAVPYPYSQGQQVSNGGYGSPPASLLTQNSASHHLPQQTPTPNIPPNASLALSAALRILGTQLAATPAVQQLVAQAPNAGDQEMRIVQECIIENGQAAQDLGVLTRMLQLKSLAKSQGARSQASAPPGERINEVNQGPASAQPQQPEQKMDGVEQTKAVEQPQQ